MRYAAIDIGTNAARLLIGQVAGEPDALYVQKLSYTRIPLRLGASVFDDGLISEKKTAEFLKTMQVFKLIADIFEVKEVRACATSAMRVASNGKAVQALITKETGTQIEIISGEEEADLIFSTFSLMNFDKSMPFVVIDVGGGSTEISVLDGGERIASKSFDLGTIRILQQKFNPEIWNEVHDWLSENVNLDLNPTIYATGGNINKVHKLLGARYLEPISYNDILLMRNEFHGMTMEELIRVHQLRPDRADVIVPALDIYLHIMKVLDCKEIVVPKIGLSDGMISTMHKKNA